MEITLSLITSSGGVKNILAARVATEINNDKIEGVIANTFNLMDPFNAKKKHTCFRLVCPSELLWKEQIVVLVASIFNVKIPGVDCISDSIEDKLAQIQIVQYKPDDSRLNWWEDNDMYLQRSATVEEIVEYIGSAQRTPRQVAELVNRFTNLRIIGQGLKMNAAELSHIYAPEYCKMIIKLQSWLKYGVRM